MPCHAMKTVPLLANFWAILETGTRHAQRSPLGVGGALGPSGCSSRDVDWTVHAATCSKAKHPSSTNYIGLWLTSTQCPVPSTPYLTALMISWLTDRLRRPPAARPAPARSRPTLCARSSGEHLDLPSPSGLTRQVVQLLRHVFACPHILPGRP